VEEDEEDENDARAMSTTRRRAKRWTMRVGVMRGRM